MGTINDKLEYLNQTKQDIKQAIINKGQNITEEDTFRSYVDKINDIQLGILSEEEAQLLNINLDLILNEKVPELVIDLDTGSLSGGYIGQLFNYDENVQIGITQSFIQTGTLPLTYPIPESAYCNRYVFIKNISNRTINVTQATVTISQGNDKLYIGYSAQWWGDNGTCILQPNEVYSNNQLGTIGFMINNLRELKDSLNSRKYFNVDYTFVD